MAEQDAADPALDMFFPDAEGDDSDDDDFAGMEAEDFDGRMIDTLRVAGVDEDTAFKLIKAIRHEKLAKRKQETFVELYGQGSLCAEAREVPAIDEP